MNLTIKENLIKEINQFREDTKKYRDLLSGSRNEFVEIIRNHKQISDMRSDLNKKYGYLEKYFYRFGRRPLGCDGVNPVKYSVYDSGLSNDILQRRGPSLDAMINDLDFIVGKLESISQSEIDDIFNEKEKHTINIKKNVETNKINKRKSNRQIEGVEIYARNVVNNGVITSNSKTKLVAENYKGKGEVSSFDKNKSSDKWHQKWWGQLLIMVFSSLTIGFFIFKLGWN